MVRLISILFILLFFSQYSNAQEFIIREGNRLFQEGYYEEAIENYLQAEELKFNDPSLNYQLALCYFYVENYSDAIRFSNKVIEFPGAKTLEAYIIKAKALDIQGKRNKSIALLEEASELSDNHYAILYNLGELYFQEKQYEDTERVLLEALEKKPAHIQSHLILGKTQEQLEHTSTKLLAYYFYILLDPTSEEGDKIIEHLHQVLFGEVEIKVAQVDDLILNANTKIEFAGSDLAIQANAKTFKSDLGNASEMEIFIASTDAFFKTLGEIRKQNTGIWWSLYVDFFSRLANEGHTETFCHYIHQMHSDASHDWVSSEFQKVQNMVQWMNSYQERYYQYEDEQ
ncbi:tetratricopeptide repeat protein [Sediminitomix flava]|uniref:Tetratricopeptide repeat protein n=1 Tax=Sediminitomix flava TaxID=379075 RepID=A0A315Z862_SEDFL|nr:tetratricopeptide repeat protein [Sediminitomix flava]PWJ40745.1 tetratricopeptide repeat protein [Sediminitomix flava]